ncbi:MAG: hypothetical protein K2O39_06180, partial [Clostridiales bacterium]|nr:hypothetical protein [Clostridiales bacterium]
MTFKLKKTELIKALIVALCALAVAFAVILFLPRGAASADEPVVEATYTVTWEYKMPASEADSDAEAGEDEADTTADEWQSFQNDKVLFTYEEGVDYSSFVRAKIEHGEDAAVYVYNNDEDMHLTYS